MLPMARTVLRQPSSAKESRSVEGHTVAIPSGELTKSYGKIHHFVAGKIHYFDWAIFNSKLLVHQRVSFPVGEHCG